MRELTYNEAALEAIAEEMRRDPKIFYMSTDTIPPLLKEFGEQRIKATPITEAAFTGMAIGAAGCGFRPIADWRQVTFCFVAMDQIVNQAAKIHYMFGGQVPFPILFRASVGGGGLVAAQHSQSPYSMFMNVAGLKMFLPSTPYDMKGLLKTAIRDNNPVISFESSRLMGRKGPRTRRPSRASKHRRSGSAPCKCRSPIARSSKAPSSRTGTGSAPASARCCADGWRRLRPPSEGGMMAPEQRRLCRIYTPKGERGWPTKA
jgi:hypothetical protein